MPRLLVLTAGELTRDPRALRCIDAANRYGFDVVGVSGATADPVRTPGVEVLRPRESGIAGALRAAGLGGPAARGAARRELQGLLRLGRTLLLTARLVRAARAAGEVAVVHAHDFDTLPAGTLLARRGHARLVYDAHELYSEVDVDPPRLTRAPLRALEGVLARRADAVVTVGDAIAGELARTLRLRRPPLVVRNLPALTEVETNEQADGPLRVVYQAANDHPIRPLDLVLDAAERAPGVVLTIRMLNVDRKRLRGEIERRGLAERVHVAPPVEPTELIAALSPFEVGLVLQLPLNENARLGLPNKLFEYLMAGLAVLVPDGGAMAELASSEEVGVAYDAGSAADLAAALIRLADDRAEVSWLRESARNAARTRYNAAVDEPLLARAWGVADR